MARQPIIKSSLEEVFYLSPSGKIHRQECRYCRPDKDGWQKVESVPLSIKEGNQICRLCCPPFLESETKPEIDVRAPQPQSKEQAQAKPETQGMADPPERGSREKEQQQEEKPAKKRYKILAGNGCHQAIAEIEGVLLRPENEGEKFYLILPDGTRLEATFKHSHAKWLAYHNDSVIGKHWFRGYPKMKEDKLVCFQIIAWDGNMPTSERGWERWEFTGLWTAQKNLTVQRSMSIEEVRKQAKETGFIKKFKYTFTNSRDWVASKKLWVGYVYKLLCRREGDTLKIQKVIPYACPRIKPDPNKGRAPKDKSHPQEQEKKPQ